MNNIAIQLQIIKLFKMCLNIKENNLINMIELLLNMKLNNYLKIKEKLFYVKLKRIYLNLTFVIKIKILFPIILY